ncbi:hypothetical protein IL306_008810 [Fusarium sp. DS 682]|nr:hypothetical protein IL306_008810 [Fusarium sp. DS 682]
MGKAKSAADALRLGSERSAAKESNIVNGELVHRTLQPAVERNYNKMMEFWLEYQRIETKASVHDLESLKDFIRKVAYGIDGEDAEDREFDVPGWETVRKYWNAFTAAWQRTYPKESISRGLAQSVTEVSILTLACHWILENVNFIVSSSKGLWQKRWACRNTKDVVGLLRKMSCSIMQDSSGRRIGLRTNVQQHLLMIGVSYWETPTPLPELESISSLVVA